MLVGLFFFHILKFIRNFSTHIEMARNKVSKEMSPIPQPSGNVK